MNKELVKSMIIKNPCGCSIWTVATPAGRNKTNLSGFEIQYCNLHQAATDLLATLKLIKIIRDRYRNEGIRFSGKVLDDALEAVITQAEKKE